MLTNYIVQSSRALKRRTFLITTTTSMAGLLVYGCGTQDKNANLALVWDRESIIGIGKKYRAAFPEEDSEEKLKGHLEATDSDIEKALKADFAAGRTVQVDGWIISVTEARQCALFSLLQPA